MVEMVNIIARGLDGTQTTTSTPTPIASTTSSTDASASTSANASSNNSTTQSPLLFFVALGFGVVFTNLWYAFNRDCYLPST
jgi:hypothetical protein